MTSQDCIGRHRGKLSQGQEPGVTAGPDKKKPRHPAGLERTSVACSSRGKAGAGPAFYNAYSSRVRISPSRSDRRLV